MLNSITERKEKKNNKIKQNNAKYIYKFKFIFFKLLISENIN